MTTPRSHAQLERAFADLQKRVADLERIVAKYTDAAWVEGKGKKK